MNKQSTAPTQSRLELIQNGIKKIYKVNKKLSIVLIVLSVLNAVSNIGSELIPQPTDPGTTESYPPLKADEISLIVAMVVILIFVSLVLYTFVYGMLAYATYKAIDGKKPSISEAFEAVQSKFWTLVWLNVIIFFRVIGGLLLLVVPGIRAGLRYTIAPIVLFDENLSAKDTANRSRDIAKNNLNSLLIMNLVSVVIFPITSLIYYGSLVTMYPYFKNKLSTSSRPQTK